jgi:hypothetical protein
MVERGSPLGTPRDNVALQRDDTSVLRNYEATMYCGGADSAIDASPGEDGILGSRERSTVNPQMFLLDQTGSLAKESLCSNIPASADEQDYKILRSVDFAKP